MTIDPQREQVPSQLPLSKPPKLKGGSPFLGHLMEFQRDPIKTLLRGVQEEGELYRFYIGPAKFVLFSGVDAHDAYFKASEDELDPKSVYQFTVPIFGRGVAYDVPSPLMAEQMGFLFPALRESSMRRFVRLIFEEISLFVESMGESGTLDLPVAMNELTVKIASRCFIGEEVRNKVDSGFAAAYHQLQNGINTIGFFLPRLPIPSHRARDKARETIASIFGDIINERRRTGAHAEDFMQTLMESHYKDGRAVSDEEVIGILITTLFAGQHTSAVLATWVALELLKDQVYLELIREETKQLYNDDAQLSFDGLKQQQVVERAVRENERLHPPLILLVRKVLKDFEFRNHVIPKDTFAIVSPAVSHRLTDLFTDPDCFDPNRFAPPRSEGQQHQHALIGFGGGKHRCMGKNFAIMQIKSIWSVLLDQFDFELETSFPQPNYGSWVTGPVEPCLLRYSRRKHTTFSI